MPGRKTPLPSRQAVPARAPSIAPDAWAASRRPTARASREEELRCLFRGFMVVLTEPRMTLDDPVWVRVFSPDLCLRVGFPFRVVQYFSRDLPARAFVATGPRPA